MHVYFLKLDSCSEAGLRMKYINNRNKAISYLYMYQLQMNKIHSKLC